MRVMKSIHDTGQGYASPDEEASFEECLHLIEIQKLSGKGLGWNDVQLLASAKIEGIPLWSLDKALQGAAKVLGLAFKG